MFYIWKSELVSISCYRQPEPTGKNEAAISMCCFCAEVCQIIAVLISSVLKDALSVAVDLNCFHYLL